MLQINHLELFPPYNRLSYCVFCSLLWTSGVLLTTLLTAIRFATTSPFPDALFVFYGVSWSFVVAFWVYILCWRYVKLEDIN